MKKLLLTTLSVLLITVAGYSQRFVYVDTEYILDNVPEYKAAQKKLDEIADGWRAEIDKRYKEIDNLYKAYQAEYIILPEETRQQRQKQIENSEKAVKE
jgi:outer membrane protein